MWIAINKVIEEDERVVFTEDKPKYDPDDDSWWGKEETLGLNPKNYDWITFRNSPIEVDIVPGEGVWLAREKGGALIISNDKPERDGSGWTSWNYVDIDSSLFPEITFENSPVEKKLVPKKPVANGPKEKFLAAMNYDKEERWTWNYAMKVLDDYIEWAEKQGWTKVEDELPEDFVTILINDSDYTWYYISEEDRFYQVGSGYSIPKGDVKYWMKKP